MGDSSPIPHPKSWRVVALADICLKIGSGSTPRGGQSAYLEKRSNYALVRSQNVFDRYFSCDGLAFISDEQVNGLRNVELKASDILLNITGDGVTFARACMVPEEILPACVNQHVSIVRVNKRLAEPGFVLSYLTHKDVKSYIESFNAGGSRRAITKGHIESFRLPLPSLTDQKSIAHILGTLDDKIELNRRMNATLEAMAQALFKSWFVDFDPVIDNALAAGNPIPEELQARADARAALGDKRKPLPEAIQKQFPSRFVFTEEMGWVPEGWKPTPLDRIADYQNGLALQNFRPEDEANFLPVVKIAQLRQGFADGEEKASPNIKAECIIDNGDVIFSWSGSLMVDIWCGGKAALNQHLFKVTSSVYPKWFFHQYTVHHLDEFQRIAADKAVTMGHIKREHLSRAYCVSPPKEVLAAGSSLMDVWMKRAIACRLESRQLATVRDTLLPKLLSGELRIPDAEKQVAEAV